MSDAFDPARCPRAAAYVRLLPHGLASHPDAQLNADVLAPVRERFGAELENVTLPEAVRAALAAAGSATWVPDTAANALYLACFDLGFADDAEFASWGHEVTTKVLRRPLFRMLVAVLSPTLVAMGGSKRWGAFHRGSELLAAPAVKVGNRIELHASLRFPRHLFPRAMIAFNAEAIRAAVDAAGAKDSKVTVVRFGEENAEYVLGWSS